jgi:TPR repeat protein
MPSTVPSVYVKIISACLDQEPNKRPVLTDIMQQLKTYETHHEIDSRNIYSQAQEQESKKNFFVAFELYKQSAELGYKRGYTNVGTFYLTGRGGVVPVDKPQAYTWFLQGAKAGHARAQYNAAEMLNTGDGIPKDQRAARQWYRTAARQQYEIAKIRCAELNIDTARSRSVSPK